MAQFAVQRQPPPEECGRVTLERTRTLTSRLLCKGNTLSLGGTVYLGLCDLGLVLTNTRTMGQFSNDTSSEPMSSPVRHPNHNSSSDRLLGISVDRAVGGGVAEESLNPKICCYGAQKPKKSSP